MMSMKKMRSKAKVALASASVAALSAPVLAFADEAGGSAQAMQTAMNGVKTEFLSAVAVVAPIAIGIVAAPMVWKLGIKFFQRITHS